MKFHVLTLFPEMFQAVTSSILGRAADKGILEFDFVNIRDFTKDKHHRADDTPFGGGPGMVMLAEPIYGAMEHVSAKNKRVLYLSPRGRILDQELIQELAGEEELVLLCGHYEGVDERVLNEWEVEEVSIGDYILTGGELASMVLMDAVARLIPGVLASEEGALGESVYSGLLEYPQYTRPREYEGRAVPEVLLSGDHKRIDLWRFEQSLRLTKERRPDLYEHYVKNCGRLSKDEQKVVEKVEQML